MTLRSLIAPALTPGALAPSIQLYELRTVLLVGGVILFAGISAPAVAQEAEGTTEVKSVSITPLEERPDLSVQTEVKGLSAEEPLRAGEEATLQVTVVNNGEQAAGRVEAWATPETQRSGLRLQGDTVSDTGAIRIGSVGALRPSTEVTFTGTLSAENNVSGERWRYSVEVREENGFDPESRSTVAVETEARRPPSLKLRQVEVASNRNKLLPGESSQVRFEVRNAGPGPAREVEAEITAGSGGTLEGSSRQSLGTLQPGESTSISKPVSATLASMRESGRDVPLQVRLEGKSGRYSKTLKRSLPVAIPVDRAIPETNMERPDAIAVVIGIKKYRNQDIPEVKYALDDAKAMKKYLTDALGFREENIIFEPNATGSDMRRIFGEKDNYEGQLYNYVKPGESDVFIYYSGHGAPSPSENGAYLVASNTDPNYISINGYPVERLYENLANVPAQSTTVVLEACFSGVAENGPIIQQASPVDLSVENPVMAMKDGLAFTAGAADQIASWYLEKEHGLFTYYFLKGLRGEADRNKDQEVTAGEMEKYLLDKVPYRAKRTYNREQTPQVVGADKNRVLVRYDADTPTEGRN